MAEDGKKPRSDPPASTQRLSQDSYSAFTHGRTRALESQDLPEVEPAAPPPRPLPPAEPEIDLEEELSTAIQTFKRNIMVTLEIVGKLVARIIDIITWPVRILMDAIIRLVEFVWMLFMYMLRALLGGLLLPFRPFIRYLQILRDPMGRHFEDEPTDHQDELEEVPAEAAPPVPRVKFLELAEKGIVFVDDKKAPLYTLDRLKGSRGYAGNVEVMDAAIISRILEQFKELAPRARSLPAPQSGRFGGVPMTDILEQATEEDVRDFIYYVNAFPKKYIGKELKFAGSFAAWVSAGAPLD